MQFKRFSTGTLLTVFAVTALAVAPVLAQGGPHGHGSHPGMADHGRMMQHVFDSLGLTDEQQDQVHQIMQQSRDETEPTREATRAGHEMMADLMHAETIDEAAIRGVAEEIAAAQVELMVAHARAMVEMRQVLTPEQLEQFQQLRRQHPQMKGMRGSGKGRGCGSRHGHGYGQPSEPVEGAGSADEQ